MRRGGGTPDLLVRIQLNHEASVARQAKVAQSPRSIDQVGNAGLHVEYAGSPQASIGFPPGHALNGAYRPDRVQVADAEDLTVTVSRDVEFDSQVISVVGLPIPRDRGEAPDLVLDRADRPINALLVARRRFDLDKFANQLHDGRSTPVHVFENPQRLRHSNPFWRSGVS